MTTASVIASVTPPPCDQRDDQLATPGAVERLFAMSIDMLGAASLDGYFTHLNPAWERTLGWTAQQLMAEPFISFAIPTMSMHARPSARARSRERRGGRVV